MNTQTADDAIYGDRLRVGWFLIWRGLIIGGGIGFVFGFVVGFVLGIAGLMGWIMPLSLIGGAVLGVFYSTPLIVRMMLKKRFSGFRVQIVRASE